MPPEGDRPRRRPSIAFLVYQQITSVFGAIGLAVLVGHVLDFQWRSILAGLVDAWETYAHGLMQWMLHSFVSVPLSWFNVHMEVSVVVGEYLAVGVVLTLSWIRSLVASTPDADEDADREEGPTESILSKLGTFLIMAPMGVATTLLWPLWMVAMLRVFWPGWDPIPDLPRSTTEDWRRWHDYRRQSRRWSLLSLAPIAYLAILIALNYAANP
ncbi:hypothetical protein J5X84_02885 [Streptosporangiaceae bacterium NEAU-GS5]|nr:hypothetical protein [Streptosporangiaceae bacterium NEAU-GS5]